MKKITFYSIGLLLAFTFGLMTSSCSDDDNIDSGKSILTISAPTVSMNKKGLGEYGDTLKVTITSNTFWQAIVPEEANSWLSLSVLNGEPGETTLAIIALAPNTEADARLAAVEFCTFNRNADQILTVEQRGVKSDAINYMKDGFGTTVVTDLPLSEYIAAATGFVSKGICYSGVNAVISSGNPSAGYSGATGGNCVKLSGSASELVVAMPTAGDRSFDLSFGLRSGSDFTSEQFTLELSQDNKIWATVNYEPVVINRSALTAGWNLVRAIYTLPATIDTVWMRFKPTVNAEFGVDDIQVNEGDGSGEVEFPKTDMKGLPQSWDFTQGSVKFPDWVSKQQIVSDDEKALFQFIKLKENEDPKNVYRWTGDNTTPVIVGLYLNDYYLFTIPVTNFAAETKLKVAASGFTSKTGVAYFIIEWSADGENWTAVNTKTKSITVAGQTRDVVYTYQQVNTKDVPLFDEAAGTFTVTQGISEGNLYIRFRVCDSCNFPGTANTVKSNTGTAVLSAMAVEVVSNIEG